MNITIHVEASAAKFCSAQARSSVMTSRLHKRWFRVDESEGILRVAFIRHEVAEEPESEAAAGQLFALVGRMQPSRLLVNFAGVRKLCSTMIGKLIAPEPEDQGGRRPDGFFCDRLGRCSRPSGPRPDLVRHGATLRLGARSSGERSWGQIEQEADARAFDIRHDFVRPFIVRSSKPPRCVPGGDC